MRDFEEREQHKAENVKLRDRILQQQQEERSKSLIEKQN